MTELEHLEPATNKRLALVISVLALCLAVAQTGAQSAQTAVLTHNVEAANLWSFFQARTIRQTVVRTAAEETALLPPGAVDQDAAARQADAWRKTVERLDSDPAAGDGRKELSARATQAEALREDAAARYHFYEYAAALFEIAIVIVSASVVTSLPALAGLGMVFGAGGLLLGGIGFIAPHLFHLP